MNFDAYEEDSNAHEAPAPSPGKDVVSLEKVSRESELFAAWKRGEVLSCPAPAKGDVLLAEVSMDVKWASVLERCERVVEGEDGRIVEAMEEGVVELRRKVSRRDFDLVGTFWKRRDGVASAVVSARELWVPRVFGVRDGSLKYYGEDQADAIMDWDKRRGELCLANGVRLLVAGNEVPLEELGAPSPHLMEITDDTTAWLVCFESQDDLGRWRDAIAKAQNKKERGGSFAYRVCSGTSVADGKQRKRFLVAERLVARGDMERSLEGILQSLEASADLLVADALASREKVKLGEQVDEPPLTRLDPRVAWDLQRGRFWLARSAYEDAKNAARARIADEQKRLDKLLVLVRPSYVAAKLQVPLLELEPAFADLAVEFDDADAVAHAANATAFEPDEVIDKAFGQTSDIGAACRLTRRGVASRLAATASALVNAQVKAALDAALANLRADIAAASDRAHAAKVHACRVLTVAVRDQNAWIGPDSPSAELWFKFPEAAQAKHPALARYAATEGLTAGALFICADALYFAPSTDVASRLVSKAFSFTKHAANKVTSLVLRVLDVATLEKVPSPVPLKNNALRVALKDKTTYVFTLNAPGASVSGLLDLVDACRGLHHGVPPPDDPTAQAAAAAEEEEAPEEPPPRVVQDAAPVVPPPVAAEPDLLFDMVPTEVTAPSPFQDEDPFAPAPPVASAPLDNNNNNNGPPDLLSL